MASNMDFLAQLRAQKAKQGNQNEAAASKDSSGASADGQDESRASLADGQTGGYEARPDSVGSIQGGASPTETAPKAGLRLGFLAQAGRVASASQSAIQHPLGPTESMDASESTTPDQGSVDSLATPAGSTALVLAGGDAGAVDSRQAPGPEGFQARLDELDKLCRAATGITEFTHDAVKQRVRLLMVDLQSNPEMENLIIDRDVHNIMAFIQSSAKQADSKFEVKAVKREKTANNKSKTGAKAALFNDAFADMLSDVDMLAGMNTDDIETKLRK